MDSLSRVKLLIGKNEMNQFRRFVNTIFLVACSIATNAHENTEITEDLANGFLFPDIAYVYRVDVMAEG